MSTKTTDGNYLKKFASSSRNGREENGQEKKKEVSDALSVCVLNLLLKVSTLPYLVAIILIKVKI